MTLEIQVLALDRNKNVVGLSQLMGSHVAGNLTMFWNRKTKHLWNINQLEPVLSPLYFQKVCHMPLMIMWLSQISLTTLPWCFVLSMFPHYQSLFHNKLSSVVLVVSGSYLLSFYVTSVLYNLKIFQLMLDQDYLLPKIENTL